MLPGIDPSGRRTAAVAVLTTVALIPLGFVAAAAGVGGWLAGLGAVVCGAYFLRRAVGFARTRTDAEARRVLRASLVYLPAVFALVMIDALVLK
jgi:protoheme IX farnesyltransferase